MHRLRSLVLLTTALVTLSLVGTAHAADLSLVSSQSTHAVGDTFTVNVDVSSPDQTLNAVSGEVRFPVDLLRVVSVSRASSILSLWVVDPSYSNDSGTVNFEGVVPNPGFLGALGRVVSITFRARAEGAAAVTFASGQVLANDGNGTNILRNLSNTSLTLVEAAPAPIPKIEVPLPQMATTSAPVLHPIPAVEQYESATPKWYDEVALGLLALLLVAVVIDFIRHRKRRHAMWSIDAEQTMNTSFLRLKRDVHVGMKLIEEAEKRRRLTPEERVLVERLHKHLSDTEREIHEEVIRLEHSNKKQDEI